MNLVEVAFGVVQSRLEERLVAATPEERRRLVLRFIEEHPTRCLALSSEACASATLDGIDLGAEALRREMVDPQAPPSWWAPARGAANLVRAELRGASLRMSTLSRADLTHADLAGANLGGSRLDDCLLEGANLAGADLEGAHLGGAQLAGASLEDAMLENADLRDASLRFVEARRCVFESADLQRVDLWGAHLDEAVLGNADLRGARLIEASLRGASLTGASLQDADLSKADLCGANLEGATLLGATVDGVKLTGAILRRARLQGLDLTTAELAGAHLSGAWLERTHLQREQLVGGIGEELAGDYEGAGRGYLVLERNFTGLGQTDSASWAYRKRRRMQKLSARKAAVEAAAARSWRVAARQLASYLGDGISEWLCDYGESVPRVLRAMLVVFVGFAVLYGAMGSVVHPALAPGGANALAVTRDPLDMAVFSLLAMTTSGNPAVGLIPRHVSVHFLTGIQALLGIFLTGLLGFVVGNRIRR